MPFGASILLMVYMIFIKKKNKNKNKWWARALLGLALCGSVRVGVYAVRSVVQTATAVYVLAESRGGD
jgi:hypothetical protein